MGMLDYIHYKGKEYQSRTTPAQLCDEYEIKSDNTLWYEDYELEVIDDGQSIFGPRWEKKNKRWVFCEDFTGEIRFYRAIDADKWEELTAYFINGKTESVNELN